MKERNPYKYFYGKLKNRAKERRHSFSLTLTQFTCFCRMHDLLSKRGKTALCLSVDRIDGSQGYHMWNIQPLTVSANSRKGITDKRENAPL